MSDSTTTGNSNIVIQDVTDSVITVSVNGDLQKIQNGLAELKDLMEKNKLQTFQTADKIYNIANINEANFGAIVAKKAFNVLLTRKLMVAIKDYSKAANRFLENDVADILNWETKSEFSDYAKNVIEASFVGILGIQLRKLMSIGKEDLTEGKKRTYIENCLITAKRALQLICFAYISRLWDAKKETNFVINSDSLKTLRRFFESSIELNIAEYPTLFKTLVTIFDTNNLSHPFTEINGALFEGFSENSSFSKAYSKLKAIKEQLDQSDFDIDTCFEAESELTTILETLSFLATYKIVSIKSVDFESPRSSKPRFLHKYEILGFNNKFEKNSENVNYTENSIDTDAILLYKGRYEESINLFPFIIDINALTFDQKVNICIYSSIVFEDKSLNYFSIEKNELINFIFKNTLQTAPNINEIILDKPKFISLKIDTVITLFQDAKKMILDLPDIED